MNAILGTTLALGLTTAVCAARPAVFDLEFPGGTLAQFVQALQAASPQSNIVLQKSGGTADVPAMSLHGVTAEACVFVVGAIPDVNVETIDTASGGNQIWVIDSWQYVRTGAVRGGRTVRHAVSNATEVFALPASYQSAEGAATVREVLMSISELGGEPAPTIKVLADVSLLAIHGTARQLEVCGTTLGTMPHRVARKQAESGREPRTAGTTSEYDTLLARVDAASKARGGATTPEEAAAARKEFKEAFNALRKHHHTQAGENQSP